MKRIAILLTTVLALVTILVPLASDLATAAPAVPLITVEASGLDGLPLANATVALIDFTNPPSKVVAYATTDKDGRATFEFPKFDERVDSSDPNQCLSITVMASGYTPSIVDFSIPRYKKSVKGGKAVVETIAPQPKTFKCRLAARSDSATALATGIVQPAATIRQTLVRTENRNYQPTNLYKLAQVGGMETAFGYQNTVSNIFSVALKYASAYSSPTAWTVSGSVTRSTDTSLGWVLPATQNNSSYKLETCVTQFDYYAEEWKEETYMDVGGGYMDWVETNRWTKVYCRGLSANCTTGGSITTSTTPPSVTWLSGTILPNTTKKVFNDCTQKYTLAASIPVSWVSGCSAGIDLTQQAITSTYRSYENKSTTTTYIIGVDSNGYNYYKPQ